MPRFDLTRIELWVSHAVALVAAVVAGLGLWITLQTDARLRAMDAPGGGGGVRPGRLLTVSCTCSLGAPHAAAFLAAVAARRHVSYSLLVLVAAAINTRIGTSLWFETGLDRGPLALGMMQALVYQGLIVSLAITGGIEGLRADLRRPRRPNPAARGDGQ